MFGDFGHGFIMTLFAMWMIVNEKPLMNKKFNSEVRKFHKVLSVSYFNYFLINYYFVVYAFRFGTFSLLGKLHVR